MYISSTNVSKYVEECIDYVIKTEVLLSPQLAMRVRCASFINSNGGRGNNKEHDKATELQIQDTKGLIRGLMAYKKKKTIIAASKAAAVLKEICDNFKQDIGIKETE